MAQNRVQYQHGLPMLEFFETYRSYDQCEALVRSWRWPRGFACPRCAQTEHSEFRRSARLLLPVQRLPLSMQPGQRHDLRVH